MDTTVTLYALIALMSALIGYFGFRLVKDKKTEKDATVLATVIEKLDNIIKNVENIRLDLKAEEKARGELAERLTRVEESAKQAHKRINDLKKESM